MMFHFTIGAKKMAENNPESDIGAVKKENVEPSIEVSLPELPDLHANHCAAMKHKHGHRVGIDRYQADKSSA